MGNILVLLVFWIILSFQCLSRSLHKCLFLLFTLSVLFTLLLKLSTLRRLLFSSPYIHSLILLHSVTLVFSQTLNCPLAIFFHFSPSSFTPLHAPLHFLWVRKPKCEICHNLSLLLNQDLNTKSFGTSVCFLRTWFVLLTSRSRLLWLVKFLFFFSK